MTTETDPGALDSPVPPPAPNPLPLDEPTDGVPAVVDDPLRLAQAVALLGSGQGPVAVDAERASGYRYGQRAYLVQLRRAGAGTILLDPARLVDAGGVEPLAPLAAVLAEPEWVLHAASQDLPCLAELGLRPRTLFDTELAARLAGYPRVGLGPLVEHVLGRRLAKEHSAADWSTRPLPEPWLRYAALDVEVLLPLQAAMATELARQGKLGWALEEFEAIASAPPAPARVDPWRRTSGLHRVRKRRPLAAVRELWTVRDQLAAAADAPPGRLLPDSAIVAAALALPADAESLLAVPGFTGRAARRHLADWAGAVARARRMPERQLPPLTRPLDGPPPARTWTARNPAAALRLAAVRAALAEIARDHAVPVENVLLPDTSRRLAWSPPDPATAQSVADALGSRGARRWQIALTADSLAQALSTPGPARLPAADDLVSLT